MGRPKKAACMKDRKNGGCAARRSPIILRRAGNVLASHLHHVTAYCSFQPDPHNNARLLNVSLHYPDMTLPGGWEVLLGEEDHTSWIAWAQEKKEENLGEPSLFRVMLTYLSAQPHVKV